MKFALAMVLLALLGCGSSETVNSCDTSLEKCVRVMGPDFKNKCHKTYHTCISKR